MIRLVVRSVVLCAMLCYVLGCSAGGVMRITRGAPELDRTQRIDVQYVVNGIEVRFAVYGGGEVVAALGGQQVAVGRAPGPHAVPTGLYARKYDRMELGNTTGAFRLWADAVSLPEGTPPLPREPNALAAALAVASRKSGVATLEEIEGVIWVRRESRDLLNDLTRLYSRTLDDDTYFTLGFRFASERIDADPAWFAARQQEVRSILASTRIGGR